MTKLTKNSIAMALITLVGVFVGGAVILEALGREASSLYSFALAVVPVLLVQLYQGEKAAQDAEQIKQAVNGNLTRQLDEIKDHVTTVVGGTSAEVQDTSEDRFTE